MAICVLAAAPLVALVVSTERPVGGHFAGTEMAGTERSLLEVITPTNVGVATTGCRLVCPH